MNTGSTTAFPRCGRAVGNIAKAIKEMPPDVRTELAALRERDNWRNLIYLGADWLVIAVGIGASYATGFHPAVYLLSVLMIGSRQRALMNLLHQASHGKLFRWRPLNDWLGKLLAGFPLLTSLSAYTCAHCRHHGSLWDPQTDPKTARYRQLGLIAPLADGERSFWLRHLVRPLLLMHAPFNILSALSWRGERRSESAQRLAFWVTLVTVLLLTGLLEEFALLWLVPFGTSFQVIRYLAEMAEHAGLRSDDIWMGTRNWRGGLVARHLLAPHSDYYHLTHHICPAIPHHRLAEADRILMKVPSYAAGHHCDGFFFRRRRERPSVMQDIRFPNSGLGGARQAAWPRASSSDGWPAASGPAVRGLGRLPAAHETSLDARIGSHAQQSGDEVIAGSQEVIEWVGREALK